MKDRKQKEMKGEAADKPPETEAAETEVAETGAAEPEAAAEEPAAPEEATSDAADAAASKDPAEVDWKALYAITLADFNNYKKRAARDREDVYRYAESDILKDILPSVDNLALALDKSADKEDPFVKGVQLVYDTLIKALADHGAKIMEDILGKKLDPNFHEALATMPSDDYDEGCICNVVKAGWMLGDKLLRAAQVVVSAGEKTEG